MRISTTYHSKRLLGGSVVEDDSVLVVVGAAGSAIGDLSHLVEAEVTLDVCGV